KEAEIKHPPRKSRSYLRIPKKKKKKNNNNNNNNNNNEIPNAKWTKPRISDNFHNKARRFT
ncbi:MAG: hypothetical protein N7Q72_06385, partial [Spiroplasma sp. Tabriz.8]|nr:hypothetical protein [Spiroplasma sp. Tabriz.8]